MLILDGPFGAIVPVRAVPYVTGDAISPRMIAVAIADGHTDSTQRLFETWLTVGHIDANGRPRPVQYSELAPYANAVEGLRARNASREEQVAALPAGVFIWRAGLQSLVDEINLQCDGDPPYGDGLAPIVINGTPLVAGTVGSLILEGFAMLTRGPSHRKAKRDGDAQKPRTAESPLSARVQDKWEVRWKGSNAWLKSPGMSIASVLRLPEFTGYRRVWNEKTLRRWLSAVDPRPPESKAGRRHPKRTK